MDRLSRQIQETQKLLNNPETDWKVRSESIEDLATAVVSLGTNTNKKDAIRMLTNSLSVGIGMQLTSIRSKLVKDVCEALLQIVKVTGRDFQDMANAVLPQIISTAKNSSAAIRQPGAKLLSKISELVRYDLSILRKIYMQLMQQKARVLVLEQLRLIFVYWSDEEVQAWESDVLEIIRKGLEDSDDKVRKVAREVLCRFSSRWSERMDELAEMPSHQSRILLINEHRDSPLAETILDKFPELASKLDSLTRSRSSFASSRSSFRKSPKHKQEQSIEIHVSSTPPPKQRDQQKSRLPEAVRSELETQTDISVVASGSIRREEGTLSRRLFDNSMFSDDPDADEQKSAPDDFDGSQMHGFHVTPVAPEIVQPHAPEMGEISSYAVTGSSRTVVARSNSVSSVEEVSLRHPSIRKLQDSQIPSPYSRSPNRSSKKRLESPTRTTNSPVLRPSQLPRPGSFTLKAPGSSGSSTPVGNAKLDEEKFETNPLSASDEYFSKPIPSTMTTPTPPPPSTDNVTLRPRRRTCAPQDQEDSPMQTYSIGRQEEITTPESLVLDDSLDQPLSPTREQQYAGSIFDEDDIGDLTEGSDHVESDSEWNRHRQDNSHSDANGGGSGFVDEDGDHLRHSDHNIFPAECNVDEEPTLKFDAEDDIGDHLSDDHGDFAGDVDDERATTVNMLEVAEMGNTGLSPQEYSTEPNDYLVEEATEEDLSVEVERDDPPNDALTRLLDVRDEMARLKAAYDIPLKRQHESAQYAFNVADNTGESEEQSPAKRSDQIWGESSKTEQSYLKRLIRADSYARSPPITPPSEGPRESKSEQLSPLQTFESDLHQVAAFDDDEHEQLEDDLHAQFPSSSRKLDPDFENGETEPFEEFQPAEHFSPRAELPVNSQEIGQSDESYLSHDEQAGRFHAAEKLFATKDAPATHDYYNRHELPEPKHYLSSELAYPKRFPPTQMGAKMKSVFTSAQRNVVVEDVEDAGKDVAAEHVTEAHGEEKDDSSKSTEEEATEEASRRPSQPVPSSVESMLPVDNVRDASPVPHDDSMTNPSTAGPSAAPNNLSWAANFGITLVMFLAAMFSIAGVLYGSQSVRESREYHLALKTRIEKFEASIAESHKKVLQLEEDYAIWSEYVRKLTEEDEANALTQLQAIQVEVQKWQQDMKEDLVQFRQALSVESIEAAFANLSMNNTKQIGH